MTTRQPSILIVAGGTGGHLYPGIAVAHALSGMEINGQRPRVRFVVRRGDLGREVLAREGFDVLELSGAGLPRKLGIRMLQFPLIFWSSLREAASLIENEQPDLVLGMGGYLSFSVLWAASRARIRTVIHEQNVVPGLANQFLSRLVDSVAVSFAESTKSFPARKVWVSGLPVRTAIHASPAEEARRRMGLTENLPTFLLFGGSLGAHRLNEVFLDVWKRLIQNHYAFQVIHVTGPRDFESVQPRFIREAIRGHVMPYCHDMATAYAAADLVISRSGASTVAELIRMQRPSILIPYPHATNDHQWFNAQMIAQRGQAEVMRESELTVERMVMRLGELLRVPESLNSWKARCLAAPLTSIQPSDTLATFISERISAANRTTPIL